MHPREIKAQALVLVDKGYSAQHAARELNIPERSVQRWTERFRALSDNEDDRLRQDHYRLAQRCVELTHDGLDGIEEDGDAKKHLITLNAILGTNVDKILKRAPASPIQAQNVLIVVNAARPDVVEGEVVEASEVGEGDVVEAGLPVVTGEGVNQPPHTDTKGRVGGWRVPA